jgi:general secretion pathway protein J
MRHDRKNSGAVAGFTLIEALVAMALMGLVLAALAAVTSQWLPNWNRGFVRAQRNELVSIALDRLSADLGAVEFVPPNREAKGPLFDGAGLAVIFIRTALGPNTRPGLEIIRIAETADRQGSVLVRSKAPFAPFGLGPVSTEQINFTDPVVLLRAPYRISFAYAGPDGVWRNSWQNEKTLPSMVQLTVRDAASERALAVSTATMVHVEIGADSVCTSGGGACGEQRAPDGVQVGTPSDGPQSSPGG